MRRGIPVRAATMVALLALMLVGATADVVAAGSARSESAAGGSAPVELNNATVDQLMAIRGIGKVMAERIVAWRDEHGPFRRVEDLMKVKGVGEKTFEKLRPFVKVGKSR